MGGIAWLLLGTLAFCTSTQGQKSIQENPRMALNVSLDLEETGENLSKGMGTSLTKQDFINGEKLKNNSSMEDAKKAMHLVLKNKKEFGEKRTSPGKERSVQREVKYRWPNGEVPYKMETVFTEEDKAVIASAIQNIQDNSCVTFRPAVTGDLDYVYIFTTNASGCTGHRFLGPGYGEHHLNLEGDSGDGLTCITTGVIIHELMHMLGFAHEHQRPDRDSMVSVNWANVEVEKAHNLFRDSWETEDLAAVPICNSTGAVQATADFSGCVSGDVVTAYGVGYDFYSVMHYEFDSFAVDPSLATMVVVGPTGVVTSPGNVELSSMDITKLQKAYGCTGCGGYKRSSAGGTLSGSGTSDLLSPCEWVLETDSGQGISIDITMLTGSDCSTDYVEVRMGSSAAGQLVGRYCKGSMPAGVVTVGSSTVWVKWGKSNVASVMIAMWSVYEVVCCQTLVLENLDNLPTVKFNLTDQQVAGRTVYKLIEGLADVYYIYWYSASGWFIGTDPTSTSIIARNKGQNSCPGDTTVPWEYVTLEGFIPDEDAKLRCSDCTLFPSYPECEECCDTVTLSSTFNEFLNTSQYYSQFYGQFSYNGVDHNSHKVYQSDSFKTACLFYSDSGSWFINQCSDLNTKFRWISAPGTKCASQATGWIVYSQISKEDVNDESLSFTCPEATSKPTTTTTTTTTTKTNKPTNKPTTSEPTTKSTTTKPTTTKPTTTKPTTTKPTTTKPTTANPTTTKPTTTKPTITKPTTTKPTTTKPTTTKPTTTKPTTTKPTTTKTPSNTTILPLPAIGCLPCKDIEAGPMMGSYMLEDQTTADPRCVDGCVYSKGEDLYCFAQGDDFVKECS